MAAADFYLTVLLFYGSTPGWDGFSQKRLSGDYYRFICFYRLDALPDINEGHVKALTGTQSPTFQRGESHVACRSFLIPKGRETSPFTWLSDVNATK